MLRGKHAGEELSMCSSGVTIRFAAVRGLMQMNVPGRCPLQAELFPFLPDLSLGTKRQGEHS